MLERVPPTERPYRTYWKIAMALETNVLKISYKRYQVISVREVVKFTHENEST